MRVLCVSSCGGKKVWTKALGAGPTRASEAYVGPFSSMCRRYACRFHRDEWVVLSAKYGFLSPSDIIPEPYNVSFNRPGPEVITITSLRQQFNARGFDSYERVVILGGRRYVDVCNEVFEQTRIRTPLAGCTGIGYMMGRLKMAIDSRTPLV